MVEITSTMVIMVLVAIFHAFLYLPAVLGANHLFFEVIIAFHGPFGTEGTEPCTNKNRDLIWYSMLFYIVIASVAQSIPRGSALMMFNHVFEPWLLASNQIAMYLSTNSVYKNKSSS